MTGTGHRKVAGCQREEEENTGGAILTSLWPPSEAASAEQISSAVRIGACRLHLVLLLCDREKESEHKGERSRGNQVQVQVHVRENPVSHLTFTDLSSSRPNPTGATSGNLWTLFRAIKNTFKNET